MTNVVELGRTPPRLLIDEPAHYWRPPVMTCLNELVRLERGWDGYQGLPVTFENANFALRMLEAACSADAPAPQIVPGSDGDLQIEWHTAKADIELHVRGPNDVHAWRQVTGASPASEEYRLTNDFSVVAAWIQEIAGTLNAAAAAAA